MPCSFLVLLLTEEGVTRKIRLNSPSEVTTGISLQQAIFNHIHDANINCSSASIEIYHGKFQKFVAPSIHNDIEGVFGTRLRCIMIETPKMTKPPLQLAGRFFPYDGTFHINGQLVHVQECSSGDEGTTLIGTGLTVWDGAIALTNYIQVNSDFVRDKNVVELGSGTGLVGIAAAVMGARHVTMTDLPYALPLMQANVQRNIDTTPRGVIECRPCDWLNPPNFMDWCKTDIVLLADCVWVQDLVPPLLATLESFMTHHAPIVVVSYQRRGKAAHDLFWAGMNDLFSIIDEVDSVSELGLSMPDVLRIYVCRN